MISTLFKTAAINALRLKRTNPKRSRLALTLIFRMNTFPKYHPQNKNSASRVGDRCSHHYDCTSPFSACLNSQCVCISGTIQQVSSQFN